MKGSFVMSQILYLGLPGPSCWGGDALTLTQILNCEIYTHKGKTQALLCLSQLNFLLRLYISQLKYLGKQ